MSKNDPAGSFFVLHSYFLWIFYGHNFKDLPREKIATPVVIFLLSINFLKGFSDKMFMISDFLKKCKH